MKIEERFTVAAPIALVWETIRDPQLIAPCVPGCRSVQTVDANRYRAVVQVALGPIKAEFQMLIEVTDEKPGASLTTMTRGEEGGKASSLTAASRLALTSTGAATTDIHYESDVTLTGRLGNYGLGLMKKRAQALGQQFAGNLQRLLADRFSASDVAAPA